MQAEHLNCVLDDHTQIKLRRFTSTRFVMPGQTVPCLSLSNIEVNPSSRRQGHARKTLRTLRSAAAQNNHVLIVESTRSSALKLGRRTERRGGHPRPVCCFASLTRRYDVCVRRRASLADVVSPHMHSLIASLQGEALLGNRPGARGCNYWLPPRPGGTWEDYATTT